MISEFDKNDDASNYENSKISTNLGSNLSLINNAKNCSTTTAIVTSFNDGKTSAAVNGISQPYSGKKAVIINHEKNLNLSFESNFEINMKNHDINVVNGESDSLPESINYGGLSLKNDSNLMELVLQSKEEIKNDIVAINSLKLTQNKNNLDSNIGELNKDLQHELNLMQVDEKSATNHKNDFIDDISERSNCNADICTNTSASHDTENSQCDISQNHVASISKKEAIEDELTNSHTKDPDYLNSSVSSGLNFSTSDNLKDMQNKDLKSIKTDTTDCSTDGQHDDIICSDKKIEKNGTSDQEDAMNIKSESITCNEVKNKSEEVIKSSDIEHTDIVNKDECMDNPSNSNNEEEKLRPLLAVPTTESSKINDYDYVKSLNKEVIIDAVGAPLVFPSDKITIKNEKSTSLENVTQEKDQKINLGLKRSLSDAGNDRRRVKRLRTSLTKNKSTPSTSQKTCEKSSEANENKIPPLTNCMKESFETSLETDGETNPNQLYLGLLNDVMADDKELIKEPEGAEAVRSKLQRITRTGLEDMIIDQLMNKLLYDHELGAQKELCRRLEHTLEAANKRAMRLTQEVESMKGIVTKVNAEHKRRKMVIVHPTKIKRSVGIQANKTYISQGFSSAFLPDSEVRIVIPSKYQKIKKTKEKSSSKPGRKPKPKLKPKEEVKSEKQEKDCLGISKNLEQKLSSLKEEFDTATKDNPSNSSIKRSKYGRKLTVNGKEIKKEEVEQSPLVSPVKTEENSQLIIPAPLPHISCSEEDIRLGRVPPNPTLKVHLKNKSIILSWNISSSYDETSILSYQLYSYEESKDLPSTDLWQKIGSVKALELPMACTLTQFKCGRTYHFAVRAMTKKGRIGPFSLPKSLRMPPK